MTKIYVVATNSGGYTREDSTSAHIVGAYTNPEVAEYVRKVSFGLDATVTTIEVDHIAPGLLQAMNELGIKLPKTNNSIHSDTEEDGSPFKP